MPKPLHEPPDYGRLRLDHVGKVYFTVFLLWTAIFVAAFVVFFRNRHLSFIRLKNVPLVCAALAMLHLQLSFDILIYPLNGSLPCNLEFWIMNICLPLGIALFQAQNMQLLSLFWTQKHLIWLRSKHPDSAQQVESHSSRHPRKSRSNFLVGGWRAWRDTCILKKTYIIIAIGTALQILVALVIFLISRRFHASYGLVSEPVAGFECRSGWEWFPSGIWHAIWTYGFGPFILFRIRKIQDTHKWKLQTTLAILFSLPALPLWSSTWFTPEFYVMNWYWPPNLWFVPGLAAMEFIILFFPLYEIHEFKVLQRKAREEPVRTKFSKYSVAALEKALRDDVDRLEEFAATKDFTGENILFLRRVGKWKERWRLMEMEERRGKKRISGKELSKKGLKTMYDAAEDIFFSLVNRESSDFPLNLDDDVYQSLDRVFGDSNPGAATAATDLSTCSLTPITANSTTPCLSHPNSSKRTGKSAIAPFADDCFQVTTLARKTSCRQGFTELKESSTTITTEEISADDNEFERPPTPSEKHELPGGFGLCVFDKAEAAVKEMVLTNTWIRYVDSLSPRERSLIGVEERISPPVSWRWRSYFWKKDSHQGR